MPFNGSGVYTPPGADFPAVANTLIESAKFNSIINDIATGLTTAITKDGQTTPTANIPLGGFKLTGVGAASARTDAATLATIQDGTGVYVGTVGGTVDAITLTPAPAITSYVAGQTFWWIQSGANTGAVTLQVSGLASPKAVTKNGTTALAAGDLPANSLIGARYDGTRFQIVGPGQAFLAAGAITTSGLTIATARLAGRTTAATGAIEEIAVVAPLSLAGGNLTTAMSTARLQGRTTAGSGVMEEISVAGSLTLSGGVLTGTAGMTLGTPVASTSGTAVTFTGIPSTAKRITINFFGVSTNGTDNWLIQLGDAGGVENSGYLGSGRDSSSGANSTAGFLLKIGAAAAVCHGSVVISLENSSNNTWVAFGTLGRSDGTEQCYVGGSKATSATLDRVSITTTGGTNTFDLGEINISYE